MHGKNRWGRRYFEFNNKKASTSTENKRQLEKVSSTEESVVMRPTANFLIVNQEEYTIVEKIKQFIHENHVIEQPKTKNNEAEENLKKADFNFMVDSKNFIQKTSMDPTKPQLNKCLCNNQRQKTPAEFSVFTETTEPFGLLFADKNIIT